MNIFIHPFYTLVYLHCHFETEKDKGTNLLLYSCTLACERAQEFFGDDNLSSIYGNIRQIRLLLHTHDLAFIQKGLLL